MNILYVLVALLVIVLLIWLVFALIRSLPIIRIQGPLAPVLWILLIVLLLVGVGFFTGVLDLGHLKLKLD